MVCACENMLSSGQAARVCGRVCVCACSSSGQVVRTHARARVVEFGTGRARVACVCAFQLETVRTLVCARVCVCMYV